MQTHVLYALCDWDRYNTVTEKHTEVQSHFHTPCAHMWETGSDGEPWPPALQSEKYTQTWPQLKSPTWTREVHSIWKHVYIFEQHIRKYAGKFFLHSWNQKVSNMVKGDLLYVVVSFKKKLLENVIKGSLCRNLKFCLISDTGGSLVSCSQNPHLREQHAVVLW